VYAAVGLSKYVRKNPMLGGCVLTSLLRLFVRVLIVGQVANAEVHWLGWARVPLDARCYCSHTRVAMYDGRQRPRRALRPQATQRVHLQGIKKQHHRLREVHGHVSRLVYLIEPVFTQC
jgi:hypothetical protein